MAAQNTRKASTGPSVAEGGPSVAEGETDSYELYSRLFQLNNRLINCKAISSEAAKVPTPMLVLVGDQSSGKSSLVEALGYGIRLPRRQGTCTRAPLELRLQTNGSDEGLTACKISVRPFNGQEQEVVRLSAAEYSSRTRIEDVVTELTSVLLGKAAVPAGWPSLQKSKACSVNDEYTKDTIILDIYNAKSPLTIVDLPGIITLCPKAELTPAQQVAVGKFTEELAHDYLKREDAIIVCVMDGSKDPESWVGYKHAKDDKHDPKGQRTIGVLTKGDQVLVAGAGINEDQRQTFRANFEKVLKSPPVLCRLNLGSYVVANPVGSGEDYDSDRSREMDMLESDSEMYNKYGHRFGVDNLRKALSTLLAAKIISNLQNVKSVLDSLYHKTDKDVKVMAAQRAPLDDPEQAGLDLLLPIRDDIRTAIHKMKKYHSSDRLFIKLIKKFEIFAAKIRSTQPALVKREGDRPAHQLEFAQDSYIPLTSSEILEWVEENTDTQPNQSAPMTVQKMHDRLLVKWGEYAQTCLNDAKEVLAEEVNIIVDSKTKGKIGFQELVKETLRKLIEEAHASTETILEGRYKQESCGDNNTLTYFFTLHKQQQEEQQEIKLKDLEAEVGSLDLPDDKTPTSFSKSQAQVLNHFSQVCVTWRFAHDRFVDGIPMEIVYHLLKAGFENKVYSRLEKVWKATSPEVQKARLEDDPETKHKLERMQTDLQELLGLKEDYEQIMQREDVIDTSNMARSNFGNGLRPTTPQPTEAAAGGSSRSHAAHEGHSTHKEPIPPTNF